MDSRSLALSIIAFCVCGAFATWAIIEGKVRLAQLKKPLGDADAQHRLARIEAAVESIAIEVERISEAQRFSARLAAGRSAEPLQIERPITPH
jgi:hypothetical protein